MCFLAILYPVLYEKVAPERLRRHPGAHHDRLDMSYYGQAESILKVDVFCHRAMLGK